MSEAPVLTTKVEDHLFLIGLNRPTKMNAFNLQMLRELAEAYTRYEHDQELRCALLFAHGENFSSGLDLPEVGPAVAGGQELFPEGSIDPVDLGEPRRTKPVVCAVQGYCLTIGVELLLASDLRIAAKGARLRQMEVCRGIMPFGGATLRFPQIAGWGNAMRYLLTGDTFDADEALRIGVVQEVVEPEKLFERGRELAQTIADQAPLAVRQTRLSSRVAVERGFEAARANLIESARELFMTQDAREGVMSFIERRKADFRGK